jgi:hypothetical protein
MKTHYQTNHQMSTKPPAEVAGGFYLQFLDPRLREDDK